MDKNPPHYDIVTDKFSQTVSVEDTVHRIKLFTLCGSGFGVPTRNIKLAQKVCDWLNSLPPSETMPYPFNL